MTCIIFGCCPALSWRKGPSLRQFPFTKSSTPQRQAAVHPAWLGGGCPCWFKGIGGHYLPCWPPTGEHVGGIPGWLPLALVSRGDPGPPVIPSDVAGGGGWNRVGGLGSTGTRGRTLALPARHSHGPALRPGSLCCSQHQEVCRARGHTAGAAVQPQRPRTPRTPGALRCRP
ncbi:hypothetical protein HJG60_011420 [Phyllostomus discolor]|uniref:Uncharacterized protein n=1 Tax=Phyllostomus discolor TaxID=89673 RepID=A0A834E5L0_9CHIR|nr:hypothetical protein HJG60_011420 [Phyllostomus discolor]